jgi:hypothetical protein
LCVGALFCALACAKGSAGIDEGGELDGGDDAGERRDVYVVPKDAGGESSSGGEDSGGECGERKVLINELMPDGANGAEFIELYNPGACAVPLGNWRIPYRAVSDNPGVNIHTFEVGDSIAAKTYLLLANSKFSGKSDVTITGGLGNSGGQIALTDESDAIVDKVGYGPVAGAKTYTEASPAPLPGTGKSIARTPDGTDTDDNASDFEVASSPSPGVAN